MHQIDMKEVVASGSSGQVSRAAFDGMDVAVKQIVSTMGMASTTLKEFSKEVRRIREPLESRQRTVRVLEGG